MADATKRTLAELVTLHEVEPELSEVITEGRSDASLILWFLRRQGIDTAVYCISDRLDVPNSEVRRRDQNIGNRGRVVASGLYTLETSDVAAQKVSFVYDIDDDLLEGRPLIEASCVLHTDYRSVEMYAFAENPLDKMLKLTLRATDDLKSDEVLAAITEPLVSIAIARLVLKRVTPSVAMVSAIEKRCHVRGDSLVVDISRLIADSVNNGGGTRALGISKEDLIAEYDRQKAACALGERFVIRGHDFTQICCYYIKDRYPSLFKEDRAPYKASPVFEVALMTCLEVEELAQEKLFRSLLQRHGTHHQAA